MSTVIGVPAVSAVPYAFRWVPWAGSATLTIAPVIPLPRTAAASRSICADWSGGIPTTTAGPVAGAAPGRGAAGAHAVTAATTAPTARANIRAPAQLSI